MVILHVVSPGAIGGLERVVQALAAGHRAHGHAVHVAVVITDGGDDGAFLRSLHDYDVEVHPVHVRSRGYWSERAAIARLCVRLRPDVVHTHGYRPDVVDAGVARRRRLPVVTTVHGFTGGDWRNRLYERLQRSAFKRFDAVVAVSRPLVNLLTRDGVPAVRVHLIRNAWAPGGPPLDRTSARRALGERNGGPLIGWVGRLSREKGPDVFLESLGHLRGVAWTACVLGEGPERQALECRAATLGIANRVHWHGTVSDAGSLFPGFDVFVLSSRTEGTPIVLFEAMASQVPVVATAVGGVPDVVSASEARLVAAEDPAALAAGIAGVLRDPDVAGVRARAARSRLHSEFAVEPWLRRYEALYHALRRPLTA
jgi:glycosyltransferase involved in cell wall biosynthesis